MNPEDERRFCWIAGIGMCVVLLVLTLLGLLPPAMYLMLVLFIVISVYFITRWLPDEIS